MDEPVKNNSVLDSTIVDSSLWCEPLHVRVVFISFVAKKNANGFVQVERPGMIRACNVTDEQFDDAIARLEGPDPASRTKANEGRRLLKVDGGWVVLNHQLYKDKDYSGKQDAVRQRDLRTKKRLEAEWETNFDAYEQLVEAAYIKLVSDEKTKKIFLAVNGGNANYERTLLACQQFWSTEEGWNKKKEHLKKSLQHNKDGEATINMIATLKKSINQRFSVRYDGPPSRMVVPVEQFDRDGERMPLE